GSARCGAASHEGGVHLPPPHRPRRGGERDSLRGCGDRRGARHDPPLKRTGLSCYPPALPMPHREKKVIAVLPAYNAEKTLQATMDDIPKDWVDEILLVDDCSKDGTVELSRKLGIRTIVHKKNRGYGGNQK